METAGAAETLGAWDVETAAGGEATRLWPHLGQAAHFGSSITARQVGHRPGEKGSGVAQYGHTATSRMMKFPQ